jgi:hypothetical protein
MKQKYFTSKFAESNPKRQPEKTERQMKDMKQNITIRKQPHKAIIGLQRIHLLSLKLLCLLGIKDISSRGVIREYLDGTANEAAQQARNILSE